MKRDLDSKAKHVDDDEAATVIFAAGQDPELEARARSHIAGCTSCAARFESLRAADRDAGDLLSLLDVPAPTVTTPQILRAAKRTAVKPTIVRYRRAAAVVGFLGLATAAAAIPNSPIRTLFTRVRDSVRAPTADVTAHSSGGSAEAASPAVAMVPGSSLEVAFARRGTSGIVHVRMIDGDQASLSSSDAGARYQISSTRLNIDQPAHGSFELALPNSLRQVRILVGGKLVFERRPDSPPGPRDFTIELSKPTGITPAQHR